jgi:DNA modification methylase
MSNGEIYDYMLEGFMNFIPEDSTQCILLDPPYGEGKEDWDKRVGFGGNWFTKILRKVSETGTLFITIHTHKVWELMRQIPVAPYDYITWDKRGSLSWSAIRGRKNTSVMRTEVILGFPKNKEKRIWHPSWKADVIKLLSNGVGQIDWHPSPKPVNLYKKLIDAVCDNKEEHIVLDPAAGSGTAGVAAKNLGYRYILNDANSNYVEKMKWRLSFDVDPYFINDTYKVKDKQLF